MPKINQEEYEVLKKLGNKDFKWLARDRDKELLAFQFRPSKAVGWAFWVNTVLGIELELASHLFQFIQWEDDEPYEIAELIREYEVDELRRSYFGPKFSKVNGFYNANLATWVGLNESEEKEAKSKQELVDKWEKAIEAAELYGGDKEEKLITYMQDFVDDLNQLDEPETLSQEFIDEHKESWQDLSVTGYSVPEKDLQDILVPKLEEVDPDEERFNRKVNKIIKAIENPKRLKLKDVVEKMDSLAEVNQKQWLDRLNEKFGEVEQEPKYRVMDGNTTLLGRINGLMLTTVEILEYYPEYAPAFEFTEQEIKDYDERYFAFAKPVEEVEE